MKVKQLPADFRVEELTDLISGSAGDFTLYRLEKIGWTTPDAVMAVRRRWKIDGQRVCWGGLKDRHADTSQHLTIYRGPNSELILPRVRIVPLGRVAEPFTSKQIRANRFGITVRDLASSEARSAIGRVDGIMATGVPNYFDDQRFGSVGPDGQFIAKAMILGDFETALQRALAAPYEHDRSAEKRDKKLLLAEWGRWDVLKQKLAKSHARSLVCYLIDHPADFKGAVARLRPELQGLYLSAYQSHLWNLALAGWVQQSLPPTDLRAIDLHLGRVPAPIRMPETMKCRLSDTAIPLPSARVVADMPAEWISLFESVLANEGLTLDRLKIPGLRRPFFSRGERAAFFMPDRFRADAETDELHPNRQKVRLTFELPRGCYATMLLKRLFEVGRSNTP